MLGERFSTLCCCDSAPSTPIDLIFNRKRRFKKKYFLIRRCLPRVDFQASLTIQANCHTVIQSHYHTVLLSVLLSYILTVMQSY
jgi:hypothetical protein